MGSASSRNVRLLLQRCQEQHGGLHQLQLMQRLLLRACSPQALQCRICASSDSYPSLLQVRRRGDLRIAGPAAATLAPAVLSLPLLCARQGGTHSHTHAHSNPPCRSQRCVHSTGPAAARMAAAARRAQEAQRWSFAHSSGRRRAHGAHAGTKRWRAPPTAAQPQQRVTQEQGTPVLTDAAAVGVQP